MSIVEKVAAAISVSRSDCNIYTDWDVRDAKNAIAAYLAALDEAGWVVVPKVATPEMVISGKQVRQDGYSEVAIFDAMIAAAQNPPEV